VYTSYMGWITVGIVVIILFLIFLSLYFWASGAVVIADQEKEDIQHTSNEELAKELKETEKIDLDETKSEEDEFYSHG